MSAQEPGLPGEGSGYDDGVHPTAVPADAADEWHRVHPISPVIRGWLVLVAIAYFVGQSWFEDIVSRMLGWSDPDEGDGGGIEALLALQNGLTIAIAVTVGVLLLIMLSFYLSWRFTLYQVTEGHVNIRSGVLFRQQRQARIDRVQAIDIGQPLLARLAGLGELKFEVADGGSTAMKLAFLKLSDAHLLRRQILDRAAGLKSGTTTAAGAGAAGAQHGPQHPGATHAAAPGAGAGVVRGLLDGPATPDVPERVLVTVPPGRLVGSIVMSPVLWTLLLALGAGFVIQILTDGGFKVIYMAPGLFGFVPWVWGLFSHGFNFRAATSPDGLRLSYGLLDTHHQTVPPGRVQAVQVTQGVIWKLFGWHKIVVNVAGYGEGGGEGGQTRSTVLPVGTRQDVLNILSIILPNPGTERPLELIEAGIAGKGQAEGFSTSPRSARLLSPLAWNRQGYAVTDTAVFARAGFLVRVLYMVPHERTQGIRMTQGPLARWRQVAHVNLVTTDGPVHPAVHQAEVGEARRFFLAQSARAAAARHAHDRNHWLDDDPYGTELGEIAEAVAEQSEAADAAPRESVQAPPTPANAPTPTNASTNAPTREQNDA